MSSTPPIPNTNERQEDPSLSTSAEKPKLWKCGDPYKFAPPQEEGDPWDKLLQPMLKRDKEQCDAWKDEVENLLIFAGLFSAVVTAFIIESYKGLKQDPNDAMIFLLSHIAARLDSPGINNSSTGTTSTNNPLQIPVSPIPVSTSRVNVLWFISLVLSLTTVLVGTVGLQWLREHLRYPVTMVPRDKFAMFHMRTEGLERWHVPGIFSALPILLQVALALFLMGLVDFLLSVAPLGVAAPVIAVIGLPLIFSVATTTLPTIQLFASKVLPLRERVPSQCPYRSPQSLVVLTGIYRVRDGFDSVRGYITYALRAKPRIHYLSLYFKKHTTIRSNWLSVERSFMHFRDRYSWRIYQRELEHVKIPGPGRLADYDIGDDTVFFYDSTTGIQLVAEEHSAQNSICLTMYHCVQELTSNSFKIYGTNPAHSQYLQTILTHGKSLSRPYLFVTGFLAEAKQGMLRDENAFTFIHTLRHMPQELIPHFQELHIRLMGQCHLEKLNGMNERLLHALEPNSDHLFRECVDTSLMQTTSRWTYLVPRWASEAGLVAHAKYDREISDQATLILESLFEVAGSQNTAEVELDTVKHFQVHPYLPYFTEMATDMQYEPAKLSTLNSIIVQLNRCFSNGVTLERDLLFYMAAIYLRVYSRYVDWESILSRSVKQGILLLLRQYRQNMDPRKSAALQKRLGIPDFTDDEWWAFLDFPDIQSDNNAAGQTSGHHMDNPEGYALGDAPRQTTILPDSPISNITDGSESSSHPVQLANEQSGIGAQPPLGPQMITDDEIDRPARRRDLPPKEDDYSIPEPPDIV